MFTWCDGVSDDTGRIHRVYVVGQAGSWQVVARRTVYRVRVRADVRVLDLLMTVHTVRSRTVHSTVYAVAVRIPAALDTLITFQLNISVPYTIIFHFTPTNAIHLSFTESEKFGIIVIICKTKYIICQGRLSRIKTSFSKDNRK